MAYSVLIMGYFSSLFCILEIERQHLVSVFHVTIKPSGQFGIAYLFDFALIQSVSVGSIEFAT